ncbi:MAG: hypothetical protein ACOY4K_08310 [Pseudomonadota bacterium]
MGARLLSFLLGLLLAGVGWALVAPAGPVGAVLPALTLGLFEGHRAFIGWGAAALGVVSLLSAVLPKGEGAGGRRRRAPPAVDFDAAPSHEDDPGPEGHAGSGAPRPTALW